ncbi:uncharacterized protein LOC129951797 [Eupeodes corollae]|uniref:uncharacterized protein LOC129951797 n=1 Tax=Eupeodes corollae TaxID=290404 RepID=UPI002493880B|nr:uncharacterized protein LOC129951797 [Eupeodes corollae]
MLKNSKNKNTLNHVNCLSGRIQSETHEQFQKPFIKKFPVTRTKRLEQFLWNEFYEEYIRSKQPSNVIVPFENQITEYTDEYAKFKRNDKEIDGQILAKDYPLYSNAAITYWNPNGRQSNFGRTLSISLPTSQQHEQMG